MTDVVSNVRGEALDLVGGAPSIPAKLGAPHTVATLATLSTLTPALAQAGSVILWEGPSALDGAPVVVIATRIKRASNNAKTGNMVQVFILRADMHPMEALKTGADVSICGGCRHRPQPRSPEEVAAILAPAKARLAKATTAFRKAQARKALAKARRKAAAPVRSCYVNVGQSVRSVWAAYRAGKFPRANALQAQALLAGKKVRLGAYGDPAAAPYAMWAVAVAKAAGVTGYSHQWRMTDARFGRLLMASVDNAQEAAEARAMGWRYFRVRAAGELLGELEFVCPASAEKAVTNCATCLSCGGTSAGGKASPVIVVHGAGAAAFAKAA